ncbi:MAG: RIP metalloprotease RseP [Bacteroidia bacterium]|nr:RIP metalloprotease RseP [Bacteroidia bacterium]
MEVLVMIGQLILGLSILVFFHELGHYTAARMFGIKVEKFYLFFDAWGKKLFSFKYGETEYGIGWLPLGGYVKIAGMVDESMDSEQMNQPPQPWEFRTKPAWQRLIVMIAGVVVNAVLAVLIFTLMFVYYGDPYIPNSQVKNGIVAYKLAQDIGLKTGDKITGINGHPIERFSDVANTKVLLGEGMVYNIDRNGEKLDIPVPDDFVNRLTDSRDQFLDKRMTFFVGKVQPGSNAAKAGMKANDKIIAVNGIAFNFFDEFQEILKKNNEKSVALTLIRNNETITLKVDVNEEGKLGFAPDTKDFELKIDEFTLAQAFPVGAHKAWSVLTDNIKGFSKIFKGKVAFSKSVQGPIGMAQIYGGVWDWNNFWHLTGLISMILAFMNILPIPALDGGHVIFLFVEMIIGRPLSLKFQERAQTVGMVILLSLMAFAVLNDMRKLEFIQKLFNT